MPLRSDVKYVGGDHAYEMACKQCGKLFRSNRRDARFCSPNCRKASSRRHEAVERERENALSSINALIEMSKADDRRLQWLCKTALDQIALKVGFAAAKSDPPVRHT